MTKMILTARRTSRRQLFSVIALIFATLFVVPRIFAHQTPTTFIDLDINPSRVLMKMEVPIPDLETASGISVAQSTDLKADGLVTPLTEYFLQHIKPMTDGVPLSVDVKTIALGNWKQTATAPFQEITIAIELVPPAGVSTRRFSMNYDAVMHKVATHKALVSIQNDWESGNLSDSQVEARAITVDSNSGTIAPFELNLENGSLWRGFGGMVLLGIQHIKEGTDHLLFLLVLLLPAPLLARDKRWAEFGGSRYSVVRLLKIATAFTVGHSVTLLLGALGLVHLAQRPVEVAIAVSILVSAIHAIRPVFPGKELYVAGGFGLVHGLAFATVLSDLGLGPIPMVISILGFNVGIELMQMFVIVTIVPWLIILSTTDFYDWIRIGGATGASVAALAWIAERASDNSNVISVLVEKVARRAYLAVLMLAVLALLSLAFRYYYRPKEYSTS
jgi:hypothetical protein